MTSQIDIDEILKEEYELSLASESAINEETIFAFIWVSYDGRGRRIPSRQRFKDIAKKIKEKHQCSINFIPISEKGDDLDMQLRSNLLNKVPHLVESSYLSVNDKKVMVWVKTATLLKENDKKEVESLIEIFCNKHKFKTTSVYFSRSENPPSRIVILRIIHILSPCSIPVLLKELNDKKFKIPSKEWIISHVDDIKNAGYLAKLSSGYYKDNYILSLKGLALIGTARGKNSPDIKRVLAMARKKG